MARSCGTFARSGVGPATVAVVIPRPSSPIIQFSPDFFESSWSRMRNSRISRILGVEIER
jgi:hypothetical protein